MCMVYMSVQVSEPLLLSLRSVSYIGNFGWTEVCADLYLDTPFSVSSPSRILLYIPWLSRTAFTHPVARLLNVEALSFQS